MREPSKLVLSPEAEVMLRANRCPSCGMPKYKWQRTTKFRCCSSDCTQWFYDNLVIATSWNELRIKVFDRDDLDEDIWWNNPDDIRARVTLTPRLPISRTRDSNLVQMNF